MARRSNTQTAQTEQDNMTTNDETQSELFEVQDGAVNEDNTVAPETDETPAETDETPDEPKHTFNAGDQIGVSRGKLRGRNGVILKRNEAMGQYSVELEDGTLAVLNAASIKAPMDSTVSVRALVGVLAGFAEDTAAEGYGNVVQRIAAALDKVAPGTSVKLAEATSSTQTVQPLDTV